MKKLLGLLSENTGLSESDLRKLILSAPDRYKVFYIEKRSGGWRKIAQPARPVKFLQRIFIDTILSHIPIHDSATAYRKNYSIRDNAIPHAGNGPILKLDFKDFFPSIKSADWRKYCYEFGILGDSDDVLLSEYLLFFREKGARDLRLSIGAPSSPMISNIIMSRFDELISDKIAAEKVTYTRYADDMTFSGPRTGHLVNVIKLVNATLREVEHPKLRLNHEKTTRITRKFHRTVTGLTLSNDGRVTIGREEKRRINAGVHNALHGTISDEMLTELAGRIAYANSVEPEFVEALRRRYGSDTVRLVGQLAGLIRGSGRQVALKTPRNVAASVDSSN